MFVITLISIKEIHRYVTDIFYMKKILQYGALLTVTEIDFCKTKLHKEKYDLTQFNTICIAMSCFF